MIIFDFPVIIENGNELPQKKIDKSNWTYWGYIHPFSRGGRRPPRLCLDASVKNGVRESRKAI